MTAADFRRIALSFEGAEEMDATHIRLAKAARNVMTGALSTAWKLRVDKNTASRSPKRARRMRR